MKRKDFWAEVASYAVFVLPIIAIGSIPFLAKGLAAVTHSARTAICADSDNTPKSLPR